MKGRVLIEPGKGRQAYIHVSGRSQGKNWPPKFVLEEGAKIVLGVTGKRPRFNDV